MSSIDKQNLRKMFDQIDVEEPSPNFEHRVFQDWQHTVLRTEKPSTRLSDVLVMAKNHRKFSLLMLMVVLMSSFFLSQCLMTFQDEDLHRIDALSELSLSTM